MASTIETGHAKNVATFEDLISFCTGYGASYNSSKVVLELPGLTAQPLRLICVLASLREIPGIGE